MPKYLLLKHYSGGPQPHRPVPPIDQWDPADVEAHMAFQHHVAEMLQENGEFVDAQALAPAQTWVRYGGPDAAPVTTDGAAARDQRPGRRLVHDRRRLLRAGARARGLRLLRARPGRHAAVRVDRRPRGHVRDARERLTGRDRRADPAGRGRPARPRPPGARGPRPAGRGLRRRRGRAAGGAAGGAAGLARAPAARPARVADDGRRSGGSSTPAAARPPGPAARRRPTPSHRPGRPRRATTPSSCSSAAARPSWRPPPRWR